MLDQQQACCLPSINSGPEAAASACLQLHRMVSRALKASPGGTAHLPPAAPLLLTGNFAQHLLHVPPHERIREVGALDALDARELGVGQLRVPGDGQVGRRAEISSEAA